MSNEIKVERFNREDIKKTDRKKLADMYLLSLVSLMKNKQSEGHTLKLNRGVYVFTTSSNKKCGGCEYFGLNGQDAVDFFLKKVSLKSNRLYVAVGVDYYYDTEDKQKEYGAQDLIICGNDYPARSDL